MCVIISKPKGVKLKEETYRECLKLHPDGAGIAYVKDKKLIVDKGLFKFDELYAKIVEHEEGEMIIHFRRISAGNLSIENCHPFLIEPGEMFPKYAFAVAHNGTLPYYSTKTESDTACFMRDILGPGLSQNPYLLDSLPGNHMLSMTIEARNKLVIMRYDSEIDEIKTYIVHKTKGYYDMGCWFSSKSYKIIAPCFPKGYCGMHEGMELAEFGHDIAAHMNYEQKQSDIAWFNRGYYKDKDNNWVKIGELFNNKGIESKIGGTFQSAHNGNNFGGNRPSVIAGEPNSKIETIVVPRDADGLDATMQDRLRHLSKKERKIFRRLALDYARASLDKYEGFQNHELIAYLRGEYLHKCFDPSVNTMTTAALDKFIIKDYLGPAGWFLNLRKDNGAVKQIQQSQMQVDY